MSRVLVTGASGFVGSSLVEAFAGAGYAVVAPERSGSNKVDLNIVRPSIGNIDSQTDWQDALEGVDLVVHSAARAHVMAEKENDPVAAFRSVNVEGSLHLARQAASAGARRFVYISSVKVNGESTENRPPFTSQDTPAPEDPYGVSKWEAEKGLKALAGETGMEVVIIRPPLVYGPGVKGNFHSLIKLAQLPIPLPLGAIKNQRSLVYLANLVDLILVTAEHPAAANQTFMVSDGEDVSTTRLLRILREASGHLPMLIPVPDRWFWWLGGLVGKKALVQRLCGSLQVDISKTRQLLDWTPPFTVGQGLAGTVKAGICR
ncbi:hypothetical protein DIT71_17055 [Marinobacter vulgaris]|uniref:NAD-dependent epimerase/dehydratase domain-containing protein n=1 Tax=Marinobacter vulgaris TaxID=1928331 RepID=A0A2V3ZEV3_9GAMM|nr:SDR family oxidoreductase [Marinobacter vulgaris]PXX88895.1 hypothetical protein DIT71_17055 [Marinobacter vulgaris]TSJ66674.1 SDR family oxidoreductase [Marinobacter vulgaris]